MNTTMLILSKFVPALTLNLPQTGNRSASLSR